MATVIVDAECEVDSTPFKVVLVQMKKVTRKCDTKCVSTMTQGGKHRSAGEVKRELLQEWKVSTADTFGLVVEKTDRTIAYLNEDDQIADYLNDVTTLAVVDTRTITSGLENFDFSQTPEPQQLEEIGVIGRR